MSHDHQTSPLEHPLGQFTLNPSYSWKKLACGCIILDLEKGHYFTLNETASVIWSGLLEAKAGTAIAAEMAQEYGIPHEQANLDVKEVLAMLHDEGVLIPLTQDQSSNKQQEDKHRTKQQTNNERTNEHRKAQKDRRQD